MREAVAGRHPAAAQVDAEPDGATSYRHADMRVPALGHTDDIAVRLRPDEERFPGSFDGEGRLMAYVINDSCIDELDGSCVDACPVDCIYEGLTKRYINPAECIDCGACLPECPVDAITPRGDSNPAWARNDAEFFALSLPGRAEPLGEPGGAYGTGPIGVDTPLVTGWTKK